MALEYKLISLADRLDLFDEQARIDGQAWPEFMLHDPVAMIGWMDLVEVSRKFQINLMDGEDVAAVINTFLLFYSGSPRSLPDEGVDRGIKKRFRTSRMACNQTC